MTMRLAKFIAGCGVASRREADNLIKAGAVSVNGEIIRTPVFFIEGDEKILVNGERIKKEDKIRIYMFHKPVNTMTTTKDPEGRTTIYDVLGKKYRHLRYVGRLDFKTSGLLLMTNDGMVARKLSLPINHIERTYIAGVEKYKDKGLDAARKGITIDNIRYRPMKIDVIDDNTLQVTLTEGKKNEVRIVLRQVGSRVKTLHRISYGPIMLGKLKVGKISELNKKTVDLILKNLLKYKYKK